MRFCETPAKCSMKLLYIVFVTTVATIIIYGTQIMSQFKAMVS